MEEQLQLRTTQNASAQKRHFQKTQKVNRRKQIVKILQACRKTNRSFKIVNQLIPLIKEQPLFLPFVHNYRVINEVCQKIQYRSFSKGQVIYRLKERGDYFYLLLEGTVHLTIPEVIKTIELKPAGNELEKKQLSQSDLFSAFLDIIQNKKEQSITEPQEFQNNLVEQVQKIIQIVEEGQSFGEMMQDSHLRLTNARAVEECHVLFLDKKSYQTLLKAQLKSQNQSKYNFLQQLPLFKHIAPFAISRISVMMKQQKLFYGQSLFRCGDIIKNIYVIKNGSFKLLKKINRHSRMNAISKLEHRIEIQDKRNAQYLIVSDGQVLGDIQTIQMKNDYQESCICQTQEAIVLSIDKKQLFKILLQDEQSFVKVKEIILTKNIWKTKIVNSFVQKRNRNSLMNSYLTNPKRSLTEISKESRDNSLKQEVQNESFFYNQFNKTIESKPNKCRFSISKAKCHTQSKPQNLFVTRNKKKQGIPHGIEDIVRLVKLKSQFQKRFRRDRRQKFLFKFNKDQVPLYIKSRFDKFQ